MKKHDWKLGLVYVGFGLVCLMVGLKWETRLDGILWGLAGAGIGPGLLMIYRYLYWNAPRNRARYQQRLENEEIEMRDELKEKIRDKSGRYAYVLGILVVSFSMLAFAILDALELILNASVIIWYLFSYLVFQIVAGVVIFNRIMKRY